MPERGGGTRASSGFRYTAPFDTQLGLIERPLDAASSGVVVWPNLAGIGTGDEQRRRRRSGHHRDRARKHQTARNNLRSNRIGIPRRLAVALDQMATGNTADDELWRQRARDVEGDYTRRHGEVCACVRWVPESTRNTMPCSREHDGDHGHDGEAIRGDVLTATATG